MDFRDFSNNLASDLGPLLALFGDSMTKQYLSECTTFKDYIIFAIAPIGIITAIISAIRICGGSYLRAFVGRAQEGASAAEVELCTSTGRDVCEMFNRRGITRVLGRPSILELIHFAPDVKTRGAFRWATTELEREDKVPQTEAANTDAQGIESRVSLPLGTSKNSPHDETMGLYIAQYYLRETENFPDIDPNFDPVPDPNKPNISLNVGIVKPHRLVFLAVTIVGLVLQFGVLAFAIVASGPAHIADLFESDDANSTSAEPNLYAPIMFVAGTVVMSCGMCGCAAVIGQTTSEYKLKRASTDPGKLVWLQPGNQRVGDQTFDSFAFFESAQHPVSRYMISTMNDYKRQNFQYFTALCVFATFVGYIIQFIGIRGLTPWVSLTQLALTVLMSFLRGCLRMQRRGIEDSELSDYEDVILGHELDWLAFNMACSECHQRRHTRAAHGQDDEKGSWKDRSLSRSVRRHSKPEDFHFMFQVSGRCHPSRDKSMAGEEAIVEKVEAGNNSTQIDGDKSDDNSTERAAESGESTDAAHISSPEPAKVDDNTPEVAIQLRPGACDDLFYALGVRARLAYLTGNIMPSPREPPDYQVWNIDLVRVRRKSHELRTAISGAAILLLSAKGLEGNLDLQIEASCTRKGANPPSQKELIPITLKQSSHSTATEWTVDAAQLEAILGLWLWSIVRQLSQSSVGPSTLGLSSERTASARVISVGEGDLHWGRKTYVQGEINLWLGPTAPSLADGSVRVRPDSSFQLNPCLLVPSFPGSRINDDPIWQDTSAAPASGEAERKAMPFFGWQTADWHVHDDPDRPHGDDLLTCRVQYLKTDVSLLDICAQELYTAILGSLITTAFEEDSHKLDVTLQKSGPSLLLMNDTVTALRQQFVQSNLGTPTDAVLCIIPAIHNKLWINLSLPNIVYMVAECLNVRQRKRWVQTEAILRWACLSFEGDDLVKIVDETTEFYRYALMNYDHTFAVEGIRWLSSRRWGHVVSRITTNYLWLVNNYTRDLPEWWTAGKGARGIREGVETEDIGQILLNICYFEKYLQSTDVATQVSELGPEHSSDYNDLRAQLGFDLVRISSLGWSKIAKALLKLKPYYHLSNASQRTALSYAVENDDYPLASLLAESPSPDSPQNRQNQYLPLFCAARLQSTRMVELLVPFGSLDEKVIFARTMLLFRAAKARSGGAQDTKIALSDRRVNPDTADPNLRTPLSHAAANGNLQVLIPLLQRVISRSQEQPAPGVFYVNAESQDYRKRSPLMWAAKEGHTEAVRRLLAVSQNPNLQDWDLETALTWAAQKNRPEVVKLLLQHKDDHPEFSDVIPEMSNCDGRTALSWAAEKGFVAVVKLLIDDDRCTLNSRDRNGQTPLSWAAEFGRLNVIHVILRTGNANLNSEDVDKKTPLSYAAERGHDDIVKVLLDHHVSVDANHLDYHCQTPLSLAAEMGRLAAVKVLLGEGNRVDIDKVDLQGRTGLSWAAENNYISVVKTLVKAGANPDLPDALGRTPLSHAAAFGKIRMVELLLGFDVADDSESDSSSDSDSSSSSSSDSGSSSSYMGPLSLRSKVSLKFSSNSLRSQLSNSVLPRPSLDTPHSQHLWDTPRSGRSTKSSDLGHGSALTPAPSRSISSTGDTDGDSIVVGVQGGDDHQSIHSTAQLIDNSDLGPTSRAAALDVAHPDQVKDANIQSSTDTPETIASENRLGNNRPDPDGQPEDGITVEEQTVDPKDVELYVSPAVSPVIRPLLLPYSERTRESIGVNPDSRDKDNRTPLSYAAERRNCPIAIIQCLCSQGDQVDPNSVDLSGRSPLSYASGIGNLHVIKLLLQFGDGSDIDAPDDRGRTPLNHAAQYGAVRTIRIFLALGDRVDPDRPDKDGRTPLFVAAASGHLKAVRLLLSQGDRVNPDRCDKKGLTPLMIAIKGGHMSVAKLLLAQQDGVNINRQDSLGRSALSYAASSRGIAVAKVLLEKGADMLQTDNKGRTPIMWALQRKVRGQPFIDVLLDAGATAASFGLVGRHTYRANRLFNIFLNSASRPMSKRLREMRQLAFRSTSTDAVYENHGYPQFPMYRRPPRWPSP